MGKKSGIIHIPGVLFNSPEESFRVHNETCAEVGKRSHGGLPPAPNPTAGGQKRPPRTSKRQPQHAAASTAPRAAARYLFLHSQLAFLDRKGVRREEGVTRKWGYVEKGAAAKAACTRGDRAHLDMMERAFVLNFKPDVLERAEREGGGGEKDEVRRRARLGACCTWEMCSSLLPFATPSSRRAPCSGESHRDPTSQLTFPGHPRASSSGGCVRPTSSCRVWGSCTHNCAAQGIDSRSLGCQELLPASPPTPPRL